jgi:6,7-dimethyl-8-ribityllumazine synthase
MNQPSSTSAVTQLGADLSHSRVAYIEASWHHDIVSQARTTFTEKVAERGISQIDVFAVPGSLEIPLQAKLLAKSGKYDVIVAAGLIVDGGIYRHDFVAGTVLDAMMQVSLDSEIPVLSVVLTPHHFHDGQEHHDFFFNHFLKKGEEAGNACIKTLENMQVLKSAQAG